MRDRWHETLETDAGKFQITRDRDFNGTMLYQVFRWSDSFRQYGGWISVKKFIRSIQEAREIAKAAAP